LVLRLGQPGHLIGAFSGLPAVDFGTEALTCATPVIRKKKFVAIQALALLMGSLHRFQNQRSRVSEESEPERKKIQRKKNQVREEGRKNLNEPAEENGAEEDRIPNYRF